MKLPESAVERNLRAAAYQLMRRRSKSITRSVNRALDRHSIEGAVVSPAAAAPVGRKMGKNNRHGIEFRSRGTPVPEAGFVGIPHPISIS